MGLISNWLHVTPMQAFCQKKLTMCPQRHNRVQSPKGKRIAKSHVNLCFTRSVGHHI
jgi:hypothetical protein